MMSRTLVYPIVSLALLQACAAERFGDRPVVWRAQDTQDIAQPEEREFLPMAVFADIFVMRRLTRALELRSDEPARNTNALDEVPNSTWFENRISARDISPEEIRRGPSDYGPPKLPLRIVKGKGGGANPGFFATDAGGETFLIKFDLKNNPEMQTATSVIVNRAFWAAGYHVPNDSVFVFAREQLQLDPDATTHDELNRKVPLTDEMVDAMLSTSPRLVDGRYRASAGQFLPGLPKGGFSAEGTRPDDPNDTIAHEHRREIRGLKVLAAWLNHSDMKEDNTLDMYVEQDGRHFLRHYLVDFGEALGAHQAEKGRLEDGYEHSWDWQYQPLAIFAFGLWKRLWEGQENTPWPAIGAFGAEHFVPERWREFYPYFPFFEADPTDLYWGAKLVMRFDRALVRAMVEAGQLSNPEAEDHLVETLMRRREKIGGAWLESLTSLDYFTVRDQKICAIDLGIRYGLATTGVVERVPTNYWPDFDDERPDDERAVEEFVVDAQGEVCWPMRDDDDYAVDRLRLRRGEQFRPIMQVHYRSDGLPRIVGIIRLEDLR